MGVFEDRISIINTILQLEVKNQPKPRFNLDGQNNKDFNLDGRTTVLQTQV